MYVNCVKIMTNKEVFTMDKSDYAKEATNILKAELARDGLTYQDLINKLAAIGIHEEYKAVANKIGRGTFSFIFFIQCMKALGKNELRI